MSGRAVWRMAVLVALFAALEGSGCIIEQTADKNEEEREDVAEAKPAARTRAVKEPAAKTGEQELLESVARFRLECLGDYGKALTAHADAYVAREFKQFDQAVWPATRPALGWSFFFNSALICPGAARAAGTPVAFYHPWSDVFLVTAWTHDASGWKLNDAEVLMGDFIRKRGRPPFEPVRLWMQEDMYRPVAVGKATTESLLAFERIFREGPTDGTWRSVLPGLMDAELLSGNYYGAGTLLAKNLAEMAPLMDTSGQGDSALIRAGLSDVLDKALAGQAAAIGLEASATLPQARDALAAMKTDDWRRLTPVSLLSGPDRSLVMLAKADNPDIYLGLLFAKDRGRMRVQRVDVLSFNSLYKVRTGLPGGGSR